MDTIELHETDVPGASLENPPDQCSNLRLRRWLQCHGLSQVGVKAILIERVTLQLGYREKTTKRPDSHSFEGLFPETEARSTHELGP